MQEILRTNDVVLISFVEALLADASIGHVVLDQHMSTLDGSIGALPRRVLVELDAAQQARLLLNEAGLGHELVPPPEGRK